MSPPPIESKAYSGSERVGVVVRAIQSAENKMPTPSVALIQETARERHGPDAKGQGSKRGDIPDQ